jgi:radical SAM protein with 4Fe4S-binding SPASM domain
MSTLNEIHFELSSLCNASCSHCTWQKKETKSRFMDFDLVVRLLKEAKDMWVRTINFHGVGEPTLHPRLLDILQIAEENEFDYWLSTNCYVLREKLADGFRKLKNLTLILAVPWSMDEKFVDICMANAADYLAIPSANRIIYVQMVCVEESQQYYRRLIDELFPLVERNPNAKLYLKQPLTWPNDTPNRGFINREFAQHPSVRFEDIPTPVSIGQYCNMPERFLLINADGTCIPCCVGMHDWGLGTVLERPLKEVWNSQAMVNIRNLWRAADDSLPCGHCLKRTDCV